MIKTEIQIDKPFLSLFYDSENSILVGDNTFKVSLFDIGDEENTDDVINIEHDESVIITPNPIYGSERPVTVTVNLATDIELENGAYNFNLKLKNEFSKEESVISTIVAKNDPEPEQEYSYKLKYFIQRDNYRLNIYENVLESATLVPIEINGTVDLSYQERTDLFSPMVSSNIKINLEASLDLTFEDLYNEDEKTFKTEVIKDDNVVFLGFIIPESIWEDFVADKWILTINASDGLSSLKNVSFSNENGLNFFGRMTAMNILNICLKKTGLDLPINVSVQVCYYEWSGYSILSSIYLSTERYFQNEDEPMDCEAVVKSIMQIFNATLVFNNGEWWIYRSVDLMESNLISRYENGIYDKNIVANFGGILGSEINNFEIFHCNANQKKTINPTIQAYQVIYQYGNAKNVLANGGLILEGTGLNIPGWNINTTPDGLVERGVRIGYNYGLRSAVRPLDPLPKLIELNQSITVTTGVKVVLRIKYRNDGQNSLYLNFKLGIVTNAGNVWFKLSDGTWGGGIGEINRVDNFYEVVNGGQSIKYGNGDAIFELETIMPSDGDIIIEIFRNGHGPGGLFGVHSVEFFPSSQGNIKSKDYLGRRLEKKSTSVKPNVTVFNGDSGSDLFVGTIFKDDSDTPTDGWNRYHLRLQSGSWVKEDYPEFLELLEINAIDNLKISPRPMSVFEGDFKGFIPYLNYINIDGFKYDNLGVLKDKKFQFLKYSYSFDNDVTRSLLKEYSDDYFFFTDKYKVDIKENFGNEAKVTILS